MQSNSAVKRKMRMPSSLCCYCAGQYINCGADDTPSSRDGAGRGAAAEKFLFAAVAGQRGGGIECDARFLIAAEFEEQIAAHAGQQVVGLQCRLPHQRSEEHTSELQSR